MLVMVQSFQERSGYASCGLKLRIHYTRSLRYASLHDTISDNMGTK
jgi:hypothetical protein